MAEKIRLNTRTDNKHKHLNAEDREDIQTGLDQGLTFKEIGPYLHRDPGTISKEVKRNRVCKKAATFNDPPNNCQFAKTCKKQNLCERKNCRKFCKQCDCRNLCSDFVPFLCKMLIRAPYVCNACKEKKRCTADRYYYKALTAQKRYQETLVSSRQGIKCLTGSDRSVGLTADPSDQEEPVRQPYLRHTPRDPGNLQKHLLRLLRSFAVHVPEYRPSTEGSIQAAKEEA